MTVLRSTDNLQAMTVLDISCRHRLRATGVGVWRLAAAGPTAGLRASDGISARHR
jgi:hypothetical protein